MHSQSHIQGLTYLSEFIKNLYTQQTFTIHHQFKQAQADGVLFAVVKLLNIQINDTLHHLKHNQKQNNKKYFEREEYLISNSIKKIGQICKILAEHCKFQGLHKHLAEFKTFDFYRQIQSEKPSSFVDLLKGIFPSMNVHKDNIPLYMPFYEGLTSYGSGIVGNPNWEISRMNLDIILQRQMQSMNFTDQIWYLILTCDKKILNKFEKTSMENIWAHLNYLYVYQTLKPYRMLEDLQNFRSQDNLISEIASLIVQNIASQNDRSIKLLLSLILYLLSGGQKNLKDVFEMFLLSFNGIIQLYDRKQTKKEQLQTIGLINTQFLQLFRNKKQIYQSQIDQNTGIKLQIIDSLSQKSMNNLNTLLDRRISIRDFLLRIAYPAKTINGKDDGKPNRKQIHQNPQNLIQQNDIKILQILTREMQQRNEDYVFPQYSYFQPQFFKKLSSQYLKLYPDKVLEVVEFLPNQQAIWKLLNSQNLSNEQGFVRIRQLLIKNQECYIKAINRKLQITANDYESFISIWEQYHQFYHLNSQSEIPYYLQGDKIRKKEVLECMIDSFKIDQAFRKQVYLPLRRAQNIMRMMKFLIDGLEQSLLNVDGNEKAALISEYLSLLVAPWFKSEILSVLSEQDKTYFWKEWACVYINDQNLVNELICANRQKSDLDSEQQIRNLKQNKAQAMELE